MTINFPSLPFQAALKPRLLDFGGTIKSVTGGPSQRLLRLGSRYAIDVVLPTMDEDCAGAWIAARLQSLTTGETVALVLPQTSTGLGGMTGSGVANATTITSAGGVPKKGMWFSFVANGRNYLHKVTAIAGATLTVAPRLRASFTGAIDFVTPKLEGYPDAQDAGWEIEHFKNIGQGFTLEENR